MNKKITLGLFALLFTLSGVQGIAISKIQANKALKNTANQQATAGLYSDTTTDPSNPSPQGYVMVSTLAGIQCAYLLGGHLYIGHINWGLHALNTDISTSAGCERAVRVNGFGDTPVDLTIEHPSIDSKDKTLVVSGGTVPIMQFKLFLLGYLKIDQITGELDGVTKSAVMELQKNRGLLATGVFDETTEIFLNSVLSGVKSYSVAMGGPVSFVSKNVNQKAAVGAYNDTITLPDTPSPQGYITYIGANGAVLCAYIRGGSMYVGGQVNGPSSPTDSAGYEHNDELYSDTNCGGARRYDGIITAPSPIDLNTTFPSVDSKDKMVTVSGSPVPVMQFKLALLGYMSAEQINGKLDDITKSAIMDFQKNRGLSVTGVFDEKTEIFFNSVLSGVKQSSVLTGGKFIFEDINQKSLSTLNDDTNPTDPSNPTPQGFVVYTNAAGQTRCAYLTPSGALYFGGTINWNLSINSIDSPYDSRGCDGARRAYQ